MQWNSQTQKKFQLMISKIPVFHRRITEGIVTKKAQDNAQVRGASLIEDEDVIGAFFSDVPNQFYSMMIRLLEHSGFDYKSCGYPKTQIGADKKTN